jgi:excisionase family DNA binding protein
MTAENEHWSTIDEVAEHLKVTKETIRAWIRENKIPNYKVGKQYRFKLSEIDEWIKSGKSAEIV